MKLAVLSQPGSWYARDLQRAATARGHRLLPIEFPRLLGMAGASGPRLLVGADQLPPNTAAAALPVESRDEWVDLTTFDAVIVRSMPPGTLEQVVFRMDALARLERGGVRVVNSPKSLECAIDKYLTTARLEAEGLPVPDTIVCEGAEDAQRAFALLGGDVVIKPIFGAEGRGILRASDPDLAFRAFRTLERLGAVLYLQRFVPHAGFDVRVLVLNGRVLGSMKRRHPTDFRTNVSRDAVAEPHVPTAREVDWALRATATVGCHIAGVDILYDRDGTGYVIEVNGVPGWQALAKVTGTDVATEFLASLEK